MKGAIQQSDAQQNQQVTTSVCFKTNFKMTNIITSLVPSLFSDSYHYMISTITFSNFFPWPDIMVSLAGANFAFLPFKVFIKDIFKKGI